MRMPTTRLRALGALSATTLAISCFQVTPAAQAAVTGSLVQRAVCFDSANPDCATYADLNSTSGVAVSPDNKNVYVTDFDVNTISWLKRSANGSLTHGATDCVGEVAGCRTPHGLVIPNDIVVSPDGKYVYATTGASGGGIVTFRRGSDGSLTQLAAGNGCMVGSSTAGCATNPYITDPEQLAFSPNGLQLYVTTYVGRLVTLTRDPTSGVLSHKACSSAVLEAGCTQVAALADVRDVAVSRDGKSIYTVASGETGVGVVAQFLRSSSGGVLYEDCAGPVALDCSHTAAGIRNVGMVAISPDGKSVYTGGGDDDGGVVAVFHRSTASSTLGALSQPTGTARCISEATSGGVCANGHGLDYGFRMTVAPDGKSVYLTVQGNTSGGLVVLKRATSGLLSQPSGPAGCFSETGAGGCTDGKALELAFGVAVSPDGNSVYVGAAGHGGLSNFKRISPPQTTITRGPSGETADRTPTYRFKSSEAHSTFQCKVDAGSWKSCTSPRTLGRLSYGRHVFKVRAKDAVGTFDPTPAKRSFKVVRS